MSDNLDRLRTAVEHLQIAYEAAYEENALRIARYGPVADEALGHRTDDGRWTLLDALTVLVHARTVLAQAEQKG